MHYQETRLIQRFGNFIKALKQLEEAVVLTETKELSNLEKQGVIQAFEFTHELAWNVMKDYLRFQGETNVHGLRDATRTAFQWELFEDGDAWMDMIVSRNKTSHTYDEETVEEIFELITNKYFNEFVKFKEKMKKIIDSEKE